MLSRTQIINRYSAALLISIVPLFYTTSSSAAQLSSRRVVISDSRPSAVNVSNRFDFTIPSFTTLGSIEFEYCTNSPTVGAPCTAPASFSASATTLTTQTGETGFAVHGSSTSNRIVIGRVPVNASGVPVSYTFSSITNPSAPNLPVYVRVATFATDDGTGARTDDGTVVFSTASAVTVNGYVPPYLIFCVGITVALDCTASGGNILNFGELKSNQTKALASEFSGSTNDPGGFSTFLSGNTMTSGNNVIPAMNPANSVAVGQSQFGMNLRTNTAPVVGADPVGPGSSTAQPNFNTPNSFYFNSQVITNSTLPTEFKRFTASYIVNVSTSQTPGIYSTTLTYVATAAF